ncbi:unnamed protein product [Sphagnum compactum]
MLDNNLCATKCEVKRSSTFHKVRIAVAAPDCRRALPNPSRPSPAVAWPKPDSRTQNNQPRRDAQSCNLCSCENLMYLLHHKIQRVLEVQDNHEAIDYYPPYHVWPSSTTALLDKPSRTALLVMSLPTQGLTWKYDATIFASSAAYGTCLSFSPIGSGLQAMKAAGILWGSWLSA